MGNFVQDDLLGLIDAVILDDVLRQLDLVIAVITQPRTLFG